MYALTDKVRSGADEKIKLLTLHTLHWDAAKSNVFQLDQEGCCSEQDDATVAFDVFRSADVTAKGDKESDKLANSKRQGKVLERGPSASSIRIPSSKVGGSPRSPIKRRPSHGSIPSDASDAGNLAAPQVRNNIGQQPKSGEFNDLFETVRPLHSAPYLEEEQGIVYLLIPKSDNHFGIVIHLLVECDINKTPDGLRSFHIESLGQAEFTDIAIDMTRLSISGNDHWSVATEKLKMKDGVIQGTLNNTEAIEARTSHPSPESSSDKNSTKKRDKVNSNNQDDDHHDAIHKDSDKHAPPASPGKFSYAQIVQEGDHPEEHSPSVPTGPFKRAASPLKPQAVPHTDSPPKQHDHGRSPIKGTSLSTASSRTGSNIAVNSPHFAQHPSPRKNPFSALAEKGRSPPQHDSGRFQEDSEGFRVQAKRATRDHHILHSSSSDSNNIVASPSEGSFDDYPRAPATHNSVGEDDFVVPADSSRAQYTVATEIDFTPPSVARPDLAIMESFTDITFTAPELVDATSSRFSLQLEVDGSPHMRLQSVKRNHEGIVSDHRIGTQAATNTHNNKFELSDLPNSSIPNRIVSHLIQIQHSGFHEGDVIQVVMLLEIPRESIGRQSIIVPRVRIAGASPIMDLVEIECRRYPLIINVDATCLPVWQMQPEMRSDTLRLQSRAIDSEDQSHLILDIGLLRELRIEPQAGAASSYIANVSVDIDCNPFPVNDLLEEPASSGSTLYSTVILDANVVREVSRGASGPLLRVKLPGRSNVQTILLNNFPATKVFEGLEDELMIFDNPATAGRSHVNVSVEWTLEQATSINNATPLQMPLPLLYGVFIDTYTTNLALSRGYNAKVAVDSPVDEVDQEPPSGTGSTIQVHHLSPETKLVLYFNPGSEEFPVESTRAAEPDIIVEEKTEEIIVEEIVDYEMNPMKWRQYLRAMMTLMLLLPLLMGGLLYETSHYSSKLQSLRASTWQEYEELHDQFDGLVDMQRQLYIRLENIDSAIALRSADQSGTKSESTNSISGSYSGSSSSSSLPEDFGTSDTDAERTASPSIDYSEDVKEVASPSNERTPVAGSLPQERKTISYSNTPSEGGELAHFNTTLTELLHLYKLKRISRKRFEIDPEEKDWFKKAVKDALSW